MKKVLVLAAALALAATPAAAQESQAPTASMQQQSATSTVRAPSIFVSPDEIRQRVAAAEAEREGVQTEQGHLWYYAAAIAIGVLIAVLLLDN
jgi:uncharacterized lipoprotein YajG